MHGDWQSRRAIVKGSFFGCAGIFLRSVGWAQGVRRDHQVKIDVPSVAENPTSVPVRVSVDHPMEPDHFIRLVEVVVESDPVAHKGTYRFSPGNGQVWVAFPMRSGVGGVVKATAECTQHGRFTGTQEMRVSSDGCATFAGGLARDQVAKSRVRLVHAGRTRRRGSDEDRSRLRHGSRTPGWQIHPCAPGVLRSARDKDEFGG